jgi:glycosyltransferase involved in cell wall biosynthesis
MLLSNFFPPDIRVEKEARSLLKAGHEVFLLSAGKGDMTNEEIVKGIKVIRKKLPQNFPRRAWNFFYFQVFFIHPLWKKALEDVLKHNRVDALHVHDLPLVRTGLNVARKFNLPLIADLHENYPEAVGVWKRSRKAKILNLLSPSWRWKRLESSCVNRANAVITVVDEAREHYIRDCKLPPEKIKVVMNLEDLDYFYSIPIDKQIIEKYAHYFVISYVGGFGYHRGIQTAISAMPGILHQVPNARLLLVGSGANEAALKELAGRESVEQAVEFTGWQPFELVPSYISASDVCLVPHIASGHTDSTIPHKIFQCMAMGKPVVVSSAKPLERIVKETGAGLVYSSGDAEALAKALIRIYRDNELATRLGEAGKKAAEHKYNWKAEAEKLVSLYQDLHTTIK